VVYINKIILPVKYPMITSVPNDANAVAIIASDSDLHPWLYNNFIQIYQRNPKCAITYFDFHYKSAPMIYIKKMDKKLLNIQDEDYFYELLKNAIQQNNYIYLMINSGYISAYPEHSRFDHDIMVFGYDNDKKIFHIADSFINDRYSFETCTYKELFLGVNNVSKEKENYLGFRNCIELINLEKAHYMKFEIERVKTSIQDYINGTPTTLWFSQNQIWHHDITERKFGINCYDALVDVLEKITPISYRFMVISVTIMHEHKNIMVKRLLFLEKIYNIDMKDIIDFYKEIEKDALICRNLFVKYTLSQNEKYIKIIIDLYNDIRRRERKILIKILAVLRYLPQLKLFEMI